MDAYAPDAFVCGAPGIVTEPYTDFRALARRYPDGVLAGEGDNRVLTRNDPDEIEAMVERMRETARMTDGCFLCIGNHIPRDIPPPGHRALPRRLRGARRAGLKQTLKRLVPTH